MRGPGARRPGVTVILIVLACVTWIFQTRLGPLHFESVLLRFGTVPARDISNIFDLPLAPRVATLLGSQFFHSSFAHLVLNMLPLALFGPRVEARLGALGFLLFCLVCGVGGTLARAAAMPLASLPIVGATGIAAGVMGAWVRLSPFWRSVVPVLVWIVAQFPFMSGSFAYAGIIASFALGLLLPRFFKPRLTRP